MFQNVSMTGTGIAVYLVGLALNHAGINYDAGQLAGAVDGAFVVVGFVLTIWGQLRRRDLSMGLFRN